MISITGAQLLVIVIAVVLTVAVVGIFLYLANRLRRRRNQILGELSARPELIQDRAFNRLEMARREAAILVTSGLDISRAQDQIARSQSAFDLHDYARSYELAQSAHETLVNARARPASSPPLAGGRASGSSGSTTLPPSAGSGRAGGVAVPTPPLAKNRAESHFQIGLLEADLASAKTRPPNPAATGEAEALRMQAQSEFDRANYSEAFRLALRGRRALGSVETLAPPSPRTAASTGGADADDPSGMADRVAGADRCPACGYPVLPKDAFCRGCGVPRTPSTCAACGSPRTPADTFCGSCGARFSA